MNNIDTEKKAVVSWIEEHCKEFYPYSNAIWSFAELGCEEHQSATLLVQLLKDRGFEVDEGVAGMPTAFVARWGSGGAVIGINCEYDALAGLSQHATIADKNPVVEDAPGHGCGHNLLGVGSVMAAVAIKEWLLKAKCEGTVVVFGTPAEELCIGKPYMARAGLFDGIDAIIDWHPHVANGANYDTCNAYFNLKYHFYGRTSHGNSPWEGRSALDSAILMGHALELLREHIPPGNQDAANTINYTFSDVGPEYPNVVPDRATIWVIGRITTSKEMEKIIERIHKCAEGASMATGTTLKKEFITATHEKIPNKTLSSVLFKNLTVIGPPKFSREEQSMAKKMQKDLGVEESGLNEDITEFTGGSSGVSDNSEYSWFAPFAMVWLTSGPTDVGWHNWQVASLAYEAGRKTMVKAAQVLAASAVELILNPRIIAEAKEELSERLAGKKYRPLIPAEFDAPIEVNRETMEKYRPLMEKHYEKID
ncbi:MAG: amidohydrolase [Deltaproteobacteria bacterium]|nr:amidohydrolase [Deltaproteobacteria bacterium]